MLESKMSRLHQATAVASTRKVVWARKMAIGPCCVHNNNNIGPLYGVRLIRLYFLDGKPRDGKTKNSIYRIFAEEDQKRGEFASCRMSMVQFYASVEHGD